MPIDMPHILTMFAMAILAVALLATSAIAQQTRYRYSSITQV
jgi:hypothetical protein